MTAWIFSLTLLFASSALAAEDLRAFCDGLDKTLRHINRSENRPCNAASLIPASARMARLEGQPVTVMSEADAQKLFTELKNNKDIPFEFSLAGCEQRAHEMARLLLLKGVTPLKGFASVDESKAPRLEIPHPRKKGQTIRWKYHVAPVVLVEKNGKLVPYTLDPSMEGKAVPTLQWKKDMTRHDPDMAVDLRFREASYYNESGTLKRDPRDPEFTKSNQESLREFKRYAQDPHGEEEWQFQYELQEGKWNAADPGL